MLAIIGGSGWDQLDALELTACGDTSTPYGELASPLLRGTLAGRPLVFLPRHGKNHQIPPHKINYRANIWALKQQGVSRVLALNAVGGIGPDCAPGRLICPHQLIDYTWGRAHTFYEQTVEHIAFDPPFDEALRQAVLSAAQRAAIPVLQQGVYGCTQGPRLETSAEIARMARDGCTLVGMTAMPEAALARELALAYASLCISVNWAAGLADEPITMEAIGAVLSNSRASIMALIEQLL